MEQVLPLAARYGGVLIALTLDEQGIPMDAQGRVDIAKKIMERAAAYGIAKKDIIVDPLAMTVSSDPSSAMVTLESARNWGCILLWEYPMYPLGFPGGR